jgi:entericidin B
MRKIITLGFVAGALLATTACNTVAGAGKDVSSVGNATTKAADKSK